MTLRRTRCQDWGSSAVKAQQCPSLCTYSEREMRKKTEKHRFGPQSLHVQWTRDARRTRETPLRPPVSALTVDARCAKNARNTDSAQVSHLTVVREIRKNGNFASVGHGARWYSGPEWKKRHDLATMFQPRPNNSEIESSWDPGPYPLR